MTKSELVGQVAAATGMTKKDTEKVLEAFFDCVAAALEKGEKVQLVGFGTFEVRQRMARKGRNPQTGSEISIPASKIPAFRSGKALKDAVS